MGSHFRLLTLVIAVALFGATSADAGPITCAAPLGSGQPGAMAIINHGLSCTGTGTLGEAGIGLHLPQTLNDLGVYGAGWEALAGVSGVNGMFSGTFLLDPNAFQCAAGACKEFVVALKWEGMFAFFAIGALTDPLLVNWAVTQAELGYAMIYGRSSDPTALATPEPGTLALLGIGLAGAARLMRRRFAPRAR